MTVTMREVLHAAELRSASLVAELSGYLVLGAADRVSSAHRVVGLDDVVLESEGAVNVVGGVASEDARAESALRLLLARCLTVSRAGAPAIHRAASPDSQLGVRGLIAELEAALIPVNRAAGRRALARLHREAMRARQGGLLANTPRAAWLVAGATPVPEGESSRIPSGQSAAAPWSGLGAPAPAIQYRPSAAAIAEDGTGRGVFAASATVARAPELEEEELTHRMVREPFAPPEELDESTAPGASAAVEGNTARILLPRFAGIRIDGAPEAKIPSLVSAGLSVAPAASPENHSVHLPRRDGHVVTEPIELGARDQSPQQTVSIENRFQNEVSRDWAPAAGSTGVIADQEMGFAEEELGSRRGSAQVFGIPAAPSVPRADSDPGWFDEQATAVRALDGEPLSSPGTTPSAGSAAAELDPVPCAPRVFAPRRSDIRQLVDDFGTSGVRTDREVCRELQELAGVDATPGNLPLVTRRD